MKTTTKELETRQVSVDVENINIQKECDGLKRPCWLLLLFGITYEAEFLSEAKSSI